MNHLPSHGSTLTLNHKIQDATSGLFQPGEGEHAASLPAQPGAASALAAPGQLHESVSQYPNPIGYNCREATGR